MPHHSKQPRSDGGDRPVLSPQDERVRQRAYALWEDAGRPDGDHERHWHEARRQIEGEDGGRAPAGDDPAEGARAVVESNLEQAAPPQQEAARPASPKRRRGPSERNKSG